MSLRKAVSVEKWEQKPDLSGGRSEWEERPPWKESPGGLSERGRREAGESLGREGCQPESSVHSWEVALVDRRRGPYLALMSRCGHVVPASPSMQTPLCPSLVATGHESLWGPETAAEPGPGRV